MPRSNPSRGGSDAKSSRASVVKKKPGAKRGARSTGRYPFLEAANRYLDAMKGVMADSTHKELDRRLRRMDKDMMELKESGRITSINPAKMIDIDVVAYIALLRGRGMKDSGIDHNLDGLKGLMRFLGNGAVDQAKAKFPQHFPKSTTARLDPIEDEDRSKIIRAAESVPSDDWRRMEAYALSVLGMCSGLRPKELRKAKLNDINLKVGVIHTEEVKGKKRYGEPRDCAIHPDGVPFLRRYLQVRAKVLASEYVLSDVLFPALQQLQKGKDGEISTNGTAGLRKIVIGETGVKFDLRACRRTYVQTGLDEGVPLDAMSRMAGHKTTKTTETYYGRKRNAMAVAEAQKVWGAGKQTSPELPEDRKINPPLIDKKELITGYA